MTPLFWLDCFPPRERGQRKCRWPRLVNHRTTTGWLGHCHPRSHPMHPAPARSTLLLLHAMTTSGPAPVLASHWVHAGCFLSPHRYKQSAVWPSTGTKLIWVAFTGQTCICLHLGLQQQFAQRLLFTACAQFCMCVLFLCSFFSTNCKIQPQAPVWEWSAENSVERLQWRLFLTQDGILKYISGQSANP